MVDLVADNEEHATELAKKVMSYTQGDVSDWQCADQESLRTALPADRRYAYDVRGIIETVADTDSFTELTRGFGGAVVTGFIRIHGKAMGLMANDCRVLGGAVDCDAADKAGRFVSLCDKLGLPLLSLCDTQASWWGP